MARRPMGGSSVPGTVTVTTAGYDQVGVTRVELLVNGARRATTASGSPSFT